jgi:hypothetical protein
MTYTQQIKRAAFLCSEEFAMFGFEDAQTLANEFARKIGVSNDVAKKLVFIDIQEEIEFQV